MTDIEDLLVDHIWQDMGSMYFQCIWCRALFQVADSEYKKIGLSVSMQEDIQALAVRKGISSTCREERVRQVMES